MAWGCGPDSTPTDAGPEAQVEAGPVECNETFDFAIAGEGHAEPLGSSATEARAGRIRGDQLPFRDGGRLTWQDQDWVIANDRIAVVIEDVGPSDLYDPWGGKPVGMGLMQDGQMVSPADFGELFFLVEAHTLFTQSVGVVNDGSDGLRILSQIEKHSTYSQWLLSVSLF